MEGAAVGAIYAGRGSLAATIGDQVMRDLELRSEVVVIPVSQAERLTEIRAPRLLLVYPDGSSLSELVQLATLLLAAPQNQQP